MSIWQYTGYMYLDNSWCQTYLQSVEGTFTYKFVTDNV